MKYQIPGQGGLEINTIILDLNGTLSVGGEIVEGVEERTKRLKSLGFKLVLFTGNTRGDADSIANKLNIEWKQAKGADDKRALAIELGPETCASIGNGLIDLELMQTVKLGIVTLQGEGVHVQTLLACDIVVPTIKDALDLFIDEDRLIATLRR
jgi:soluble P-type ATPase